VNVARAMRGATCSTAGSRRCCRRLERRREDVAELEAFVQYANTSGLVSRLIDRHQVQGVTAASEQRET